MVVDTWFVASDIPIMSCLVGQTTTGVTTAIEVIILVVSSAPNFLESGTTIVAKLSNHKVLSMKVADFAKVKSNIQYSALMAVFVFVILDPVLSFYVQQGILATSVSTAR